MQSQGHLLLLSLVFNKENWHQEMVLFLQLYLTIWIRKLGIVCGKNLKTHGGKDQRGSRMLYEESDGQSETSRRAEKTSVNAVVRKSRDENYSGTRLEAFRLFSGKELSASCLCLETLQEAEFKGNGLINPGKDLTLMLLQGYEERSLADTS